MSIYTLPDEKTQISSMNFPEGSVDVFLDDLGQTQAFLQSSSGIFYRISIRGIPKQLNIPEDSLFKTADKWRDHVAKILAREFYPELRSHEIIFHKRALGGLPPTAIILPDVTQPIEHFERGKLAESGNEWIRKYIPPIAGELSSRSIEIGIGGAATAGLIRIGVPPTFAIPIGIAFGTAAGVIGGTEIREEITKGYKYIFSACEAPTLQPMPSEEEIQLNVDRILNVSSPEDLNELKSNWQERGITDAIIFLKLHAFFKEKVAEIEGLRGRIPAADIKLMGKKWGQAFWCLSKLLSSDKSQVIQTVGSALPIVSNIWARIQQGKLSTWAKAALVGDVVSIGSLIASLVIPTNPLQAELQADVRALQEDISRLNSSIRNMQNSLSRELTDLKYIMGAVFNEIQALRLDLIHRVDFWGCHIQKDLQEILTRLTELGIDTQIRSEFRSPQDLFLSNFATQGANILTDTVTNYINLCQAFGTRGWKDQLYSGSNLTVSNVKAALCNVPVLLRGRFLIKYMREKNLVPNEQGDRRFIDEFGNPDILILSLDGLLEFLSTCLAQNIWPEVFKLPVRNALNAFLNSIDVYQKWVGSIQSNPVLFPHLLNKYEEAFILPYDRLLRAISVLPQGANLPITPETIVSITEDIEEAHLLLQAFLQTGFPMSFRYDPNMWALFFVNNPTSHPLLPSAEKVHHYLSNLNSQNVENASMRLKAQKWQVSDSVAVLAQLIRLKQIAISERENPDDPNSSFKQESFEPFVLAKQTIYAFGHKLFAEDQQFSMAAPRLWYSVTEPEELERDASLLEAVRFGFVTRVMQLVDADQTLLEASNLVQERLPLIHYAALCGQVAVCELLRNKGVLLDVCDIEGNTPSHWAVIGGHFDLLQQFIEWGAPYKKSNAKGLTPESLPMTSSERASYERAVRLGVFKFFEKTHSAEEAKKRGNYQEAIDIYKRERDVLIRDNPNAARQAHILNYIQEKDKQFAKEIEDWRIYYNSLKYKKHGSKLQREDKRGSEVYARSGRFEEEKIKLKEELESLNNWAPDPIIKELIEDKIQELQSLL